MKQQNNIWDACVDYFEWVEETPLIETKLAQSGGVPTKVEVPLPRAMTLVGMCLHIKAPDQAMRRDAQKNVIRAGIMLLLYFEIGFLSLLFLAKQAWRIESKAQEGCFFLNDSLKIEDADA